MSRVEARARLAVASACVLSFGNSLFSRGWPRDDRWLILEHPLLRAGLPGARELLTSGYVQPLLGAQTPIHEWRPVLSLTFLLQRLTTGFAPFPFHAVNLTLHVLSALLVHEALRRRLGGRAATAGALLFAVLPVHAETVAYLTSRSELLGLLCVLGAWLLLGAPERPRARRLAAGAGAYLAGCLSKEHVLLFPLFLLMSDWTFCAVMPWHARRRAIYLSLLAATALVLLGRGLVLPSLACGGVPYFGGVPLLPRLLTLAKFWSWHYVRPAVTGVGLCSDYARPFFPDSTLYDLPAWAGLLGLIALVSFSVRSFLKREPWGFWLLGPCLFLLPTSHLLMPLDTLGAQRFLYLPSLALAAGAGALFLRAETRAPRAARAALGAVLVWLGARAALRAADWQDDVSYYRAAAACNPVSAKARSGLGAALLREGRNDEGEREILAASDLDPGLYDAAFNLARLSWGRGDRAQASKNLARARALRPDEPDALVLQALLDESEGRPAAAAAALARALRVRPHDAVARYNHARMLALLGQKRQAAVELKEFLRLAPDDADAPVARRWLAELER
ncbi:MAG TPA: hypothetical protein DCZ01_08165 [Elusimicrobia bacterium]|nr:MAG: hypothetical protein A2X37_02755 [Elusimicrobia bacterium GWA2_66_18]HAZ08477.1 hypothetical protein [Elusimicrobiota bacterium]